MCLLIASHLFLTIELLLRESNINFFSNEIDEALVNIYYYEFDQPVKKVANNA